MRLLAWLTGAAEPEASREPDGFLLAADHRHAEEHRLLSAVMREQLAGRAGPVVRLSQTESVRRIAALAPDAQCRVAVAALERELWGAAQRGGQVESTRYVRYVALEVLKSLLRRQLPLSVGDLAGMLHDVRSSRPLYAGAALPLRSLVAQAEPYGAGDSLPAPLRTELARLRDHLMSGDARSEERQAAGRIGALLSGAERVRFDAGERWMDAAVAETQAMPAAERTRWVDLLVHLLAATSPRPSSRWTKEARRLREELGGEAVLARAHAWVAAAAANSHQPVSPANGDFLRGLVWLVADEGTDEAARLLGDLGLALARKIPNIGMRSAKALNASIASLGGMPGMEPLAQLTRLRAKLKAPQAQSLLRDTLEQAARQREMPLADLEELVVPTFGMEEVGVLREPLGEYTAELRITGTDSVELTWVRADGKPQKSVPAALKTTHAEELKELKQTAQEMGKMLPAQRDRLEQLLLAERVLPLAAWRERYLDHPVVGPLARRLVWHFAAGERSALGAWLDGRIVDADDAAIDWLDDATQVRLWHPLGFPADAVRAWRAWLERQERSQPFKQAHREIYVLTDAELATATYSNRFAAHVVRQHQFAALCRARGWRYQLQGGFDFQSTPTLPLPRWGMHAEFWVEPCVGGEASMSESGVSLYAATDQVRFVGDERAAVPLTEVPALVLSEVMRDVDLFVAVSSVGADPLWMDRGQRPEWNQYWQGYAFGDLSASAETRREVLGRLLPRLRIAPRCALDGRFLVVRGDLRTYKIHLGSGNILMEPNGRYLCIVPDRGAAARKAGNVWLPFEGDGTLTLILSKAFLLAADTEITDETIVRQIRAT